MIVSSSQLFYFTNSYPYGLGENWKHQELEEFRYRFKRVVVIPFSYGGNKENPRVVPDGVESLRPLFEKDGFPVKPHDFQKIVGAQLPRFVRELFAGGAIRKRRWIASWLQSCIRVRELLNHPSIHRILDESSAYPSLFYFFWGRGACEMLPFAKHSAKVFIRFHGHDLYDFRMNGYQPFQRDIMKSADMISFVSEHGVKYAESRHSGLPTRKIHRLGVAHDGKADRSTDGVLRIVSCSSLIPLKRVHLIPQALGQITDRDIEWTHIGDGPERSSVELHIKCLPDRVKAALTGWVLPKDAAGWYSGKMVDLFVHVSETEGVPVAIMEALSAGVPVLSTNVGGVSELIDNTCGGLMDADVSAKEIASRIRAFSVLGETEIRALRRGAELAYQRKADGPANSRILADDLIELCESRGN